MCRCRPERLQPSNDQIRTSRAHPTLRPTAWGNQDGSDSPTLDRCSSGIAITPTARHRPNEPCGLRPPTALAAGTARPAGSRPDCDARWLRPRFRLIRVSARWRSRPCCDADRLDQNAEFAAPNKFAAMPPDGARLGDSRENLCSASPASVRGDTIVTDDFDSPAGLPHGRRSPPIVCPNSRRRP